MTTDETAVARDAEVARLHPGAVRKQIRATFPARVVLRGVEKQEGLEEVPLLGKTVLTAAVDERGIHLYTGAGPVRNAGRIDAADVVNVGTGSELTGFAPTSQQVLRLSVAGVGMHPVDVDLEVFDLEDGGLHPTTDLTDEVTSWAALLGLR
jgi:hypothetical protein